MSRLFNDLKNEKMERPIMKENLKGYSLEEAHKLYTDCPELYRHIVKLDKYIDYLEDKLNELLISDVSQAKLPVCPDCFDTGELRNDEEEIIGTCPCHY